MTNKEFKNKIVYFGDKFLSAFTSEKPHLLVFLFHGLFKNKEEIELNLTSPLEAITIEDFKIFIEYFLGKKYNFISSKNILEGIKPTKNYALITFDDGYFNNTHALPLLNEYNVPALFFISTYYIMNQEGFWWDVLYRASKLNSKFDYSLDEKEKIQRKSFEEIKIFAREELNIKDFKPVSDIDRPFKVDELKSFAKEKNVFLGNHTHSHLNVASQSIERIKEDINFAQTELKNIIGYAPISISYPYGKISTQVTKVAEECGLKIGVTTQVGKNYLPIENKMMLNRVRIFGFKDLNQQFFSISRTKYITDYIKKVKNS
jgi:peptidoglycan/xylan/chitin deacetylase (PgdA/CDA1 family)